MELQLQEVGTFVIGTNYIYRERPSPSHCETTVLQYYLYPNIMISVTGLYFRLGLLEGPLPDVNGLVVTTGLGVGCSCCPGNESGTVPM